MSERKIKGKASFYNSLTMHEKTCFMQKLRWRLCKLRIFSFETKRKGGEEEAETFSKDDLSVDLLYFCVFVGFVKIFWLWHNYKVAMCNVGFCAKITFFFSFIHNVWNTAVLHMASCLINKLVLYSAVSYDWCSSICLLASCNKCLFTKKFLLWRKYSNKII